jgi:hypothetical protein
MKNMKMKTGLFSGTPLLRLLIGLVLIVASFWGGRMTGFRAAEPPLVDTSPAKFSYEMFQTTAAIFQEKFRPLGFELIHPTDGLRNTLTFFPSMQVDARGIDAVDGDTTRPSRYDLFYYADSGALVQLSLIYAPWSQPNQVVYAAALRDHLANDFPVEYQEKLDLPYVLQVLIAQPGFFVRYTAVAADRTIPEEEAMQRVGATYDPFLKALDDFIKTP